MTTDARGTTMTKRTAPFPSYLCPMVSSHWVHTIESSFIFPIAYFPSHISHMTVCWLSWKKKHLCSSYFPSYISHLFAPRGKSRPRQRQNRQYNYEQARSTRHAGRPAEVRNFHGNHLISHDFSQNFPHHFPSINWFPIICCHLWMFLSGPRWCAKP